jgi:putative transposase
MARLSRLCLPEIPQHTIQRGNNRQICFGSDEGMAAYAYWLEKYSLKYKVAIHAWVFMTNHVHLLVTPETPEGISSMMQSLGRQYVHYFNYTYKRTGTLWATPAHPCAHGTCASLHIGGRFKSCVIDVENYFLICQRYIELNPVRANMVSRPEDYRWSSYSANGLGQQVKLCTQHNVYRQLGKAVEKRTKAYRDLFLAHIDEAIICEIRKATNKGMALGGDKFKREIEKLTGRRLYELKRGPRPKCL